MPNVNLIQEQLNSVRTAERQARALFGLLLAVVAGSAGLWGLLFLRTEAVEADTATLQRKLSSIEPLLTKIKANEVSLKDLDPKLHTLETAQGAVQMWGRILDGAAGAIPENVRLTSIKCRRIQPTEPLQMTFAGVSPTQQGVADMILGLQQSPDLENTALKFTAADTAQGSPGLKFEILASVKGTAEQKPKSDKADSKEKA